MTYTPDRRVDAYIAGLPDVRAVAALDGLDNLSIRGVHEIADLAPDRLLRAPVLKRAGLARAAHQDIRWICRGNPVAARISFQMRGSGVSHAPRGDGS